MAILGITRFYVTTDQSRADVDPAAIVRANVAAIMGSGDGVAECAVVRKIEHQGDGCGCPDPDYLHFEVEVG